MFFFFFFHRCLRVWFLISRGQIFSFVCPFPIFFDIPNTKQLCSRKEVFIFQKNHCRHLRSCNLKRLIEYIFSQKMTGLLAASKGYNAARVACRKANRLIGVGKRRNAAPIQSCVSFASRHDPSIANHKIENGSSTMSWKGISYCRINDGVQMLLHSSNENTSSLSDMNMSQIRFVGEFSEIDDGG